MAICFSSIQSLMVAVPSSVAAPSGGARKRKGRPRNGGAGQAPASAVNKKARTSKALGAAAPLVEADSEALRSEVAAFASSLGLAAAPDGFDDSDFRPEAARRRLGSGAAAAKEVARDEPARGAKPAGGKHASTREPAGAKAVPPGRQQQTPVTGAAASKAGAAGKGRAWNEGVGPPPGGQQAHFMSRI